MNDEAKPAGPDGKFSVEFVRNEDGTWQYLFSRPNHWTCTCNPQPSLERCMQHFLEQGSRMDFQTFPFQVPA